MSKTDLMVAGPELNRLMAEEVMGLDFVADPRHWISAAYPRREWYVGGGQDRPVESWLPSTDWLAAGEVLEKMMAEQGNEFITVLMQQLGIGRYFSSTQAVSDVLSRLTPLAICLAALAAVRARKSGGEVSTPQ